MEPRLVQHLGDDDPVISANARWMLSVGRSGMRLWSLENGLPVNHGILGEAGRVLFLRDNEHLLRLENGSALIQTLSRDSLLSKAAAYVIKNKLQQACP